MTLPGQAGLFAGFEGVLNLMGPTINYIVQTVRFDQKVRTVNIPNLYLFSHAHAYLDIFIHLLRSSSQ